MTGAELSKRFLIAGPSRSGTTLLSLVIGAHEKVAVAPESDVIIWLLHEYDRDVILTGQKLDQFREAAARDGGLAAMPVDMGHFITRLGELTVARISDVTAMFFDAWREATKPTAELVGHKKHYLQYGDHLFDVFPEMRLITIFRDPRDSIPSMRRNLRQSRSAYDSSIAWSHQLDGEARLVRRFPDRVLPLRYEAFTEAPEATCARICAFLDLPPDPGMLRFFEDNQGHRNILKGHGRVHQRTACPIDTARNFAWRNTPDDPVVETVDFLYRKGIGSLGYPPRPGRRDPWRIVTLWRRQMLSEWNWRRNRAWHALHRRLRTWRAERRAGDRM